MGLIGDILVNVRRQIPDLCSVMTPPASISAVAGGAGTLPAGTVYMVGTCRNQWGETTKTAEISQAVGANGSVVVTFVSPPFGATYFRVYYGFATGAYDRYEESTSNPVTIGANVQTVNSGAAPTRNTALLPETDGRWASAATLYEWLQDALDNLMRIGGGIVDITGIQAQSGNLSYRLPAGFFNFTDAWWDGWLMECVPRASIFQRNPVPGIGGYFSVEHDGTSHIFTMWPQPARTGSTATLGAAMTATDVTATLTGGNFSGPSASGAPGMGIVQIDNELMQCSTFSSTLLSGILRGVGGTQAVAHAINAPVTEMNIRLAGKRVLPSVGPGQSTLALDIPPGWDKAAQFYMMGLARSAEQDEAASAEKFKQFDQQVKLITQMSKQQTKPRQIQPYGSQLPESYTPNAFGFGFLVS